VGGSGGGAAANVNAHFIGKGLSNRRNNRALSKWPKIAQIIHQHPFCCSLSISIMTMMTTTKLISST